MQWDLTSIIILVVVLFAGYGLGLLEARLLHPRKEHPPEDAPQPVQETGASIQPAETKAEPDLLRVSPEPSGNLRVLLEGKRLESPQTITAEQRSLLVQLLLKLRPWVEVKPAAPASPPVAAQALPPIPRPVVKPEAAVKQPDAGPKSIVAQIDELLQKRLEGTPLADREISLQDSSIGGVIFKVGDKNYDSVDAIPDPEVVAVIRAAIAEWDKSTG